MNVSAVDNFSPPAASPGPIVPQPLLVKPQWMAYGDLARILGTIAVIFGHVSDMVLYKSNDGIHSSATPTEWWVANVIDAACRWAVPIYIMLSGALLLDPSRAETPGQFYWRRLARLGVPVVVWTAFFMWFSVYYTGWAQPTGTLANLMRGEPYTHLHFVFRIIGLYAFTPMLRVFVKYADRRLLILTVVLLLSLSAGNSLMDGFLGGRPTVFFSFAPFVGYYLAGYLLRDARISRGAVAGCWTGFVASVAVIALGSGWLMNWFSPGVHFKPKDYPSIDMILYDFLSPARVAVAVFAWLILINTFTRTATGAWGVVVKKLAAGTLGIYLVHPMFREILYLHQPAAVLKDAAWWQNGTWLPAFNWDFCWQSVWIGLPLTSLMVYAASVVFTLIIMHIPVVRRIIM